MKKIYLLTAFLLAFLLAGCKDNSMADIYNDDREIVRDGDTYGIDEIEQDLKESDFTAKISKIEGMETIWTYEAVEDMELDIAYLVTVYSGKAKLVLIAPDDTLTIISEASPETKGTALTEDIISIKAGKNRIKIVAEKNTKLDIQLTIPQGEFHEMGI